LIEQIEKKDKSVSLSFITQLEQSSEEFMKIDSLLNDSGVLYFKSNGNLTKEEVNGLDDVEIEVEGKTKSQRLRNVLYVLNKQNDNGDFKNFYADEMERIIKHYRDKLKKD
jgi:hypothetical protein